MYGGFEIDGVEAAPEWLERVGKRPVTHVLCKLRRATAMARK